MKFEWVIFLHVFLKLKSRLILSVEKIQHFTEKHSEQTCSKTEFLSITWQESALLQ